MISWWLRAAGLPLNAAATSRSSTSRTAGRRLRDSTALPWAKDRTFQQQPPRTLGRAERAHGGLSSQVKTHAADLANDRHLHTRARKRGRGRGAQAPDRRGRWAG